MNKQKLLRPHTSSIQGVMTMEERYYVQCLTKQVFLIRERVAVDEESIAGDRIVKSFDTHHDAIVYANCVNDTQKQLDEHYGHWTQRAI